MMRSIIITVLAAMAAVCQAQEWELVWSDEFKGHGEPDKEVWNFERGFVRNQEDQWYQKENAFMQDGVLVIEARKEHRPNPTYDPESRHWGRKREFIEYSSACITSARKKMFLYGRMECS